MRPLNHADYLEWLGLEMDGELDPAVAGRLERHLESCAECRATRLALGRVERELAGERVAAREGFAAEVLACLPAASWEARRPAGRAAALILSLLLLGGATLLVRAAGVTATGSPTFDLVGDSLRGHAGLLSASWRGLVLTLGRLIGGSAASLAGLGAAVLGVDLLFLRLITRRRGAAPRDAG